MVIFEGCLANAFSIHKGQESPGGIVSDERADHGAGRMIDATLSPCRVFIAGDSSGLLFPQRRFPGLSHMAKFDATRLQSFCKVE
jgi:hypothetical protein